MIKLLTRPRPSAPASLSTRTIYQVQVLSSLPVLASSQEPPTKLDSPTTVDLVQISSPHSRIASRGPAALYTPWYTISLFTWHPSPSRRVARNDPCLVLSTTTMERIRSRTGRWRVCRLAISQTNSHLEITSLEQLERVFASDDQQADQVVHLRITLRIECSCPVCTGPRVQQIVARKPLVIWSSRSTVSRLSIASKRLRFLMRRKGTGASTRKRETVVTDDLNGHFNHWSPSGRLDTSPQTCTNTFFYSTSPARSARPRTTH